MSSSAKTLSPESQDYLEIIRGRLADLPAPDQGDLLDQVEQRLRDLDVSEGPAALGARLGPAADVAADLRAAAGFPPTAALTQPAPPGRSSADLLRTALRSPAVRPLAGYVRSLRPAWWAVRGYLLLAGVLAAISQGGGYGLHTLGSYRQVFTDGHGAHASLGWLLIPAGAVVASIVAGLMTERSPAFVRLLLAGLNIATIVLVIAYPTWWMPPAFASYAGMVS